MDGINIFIAGQRIGNRSQAVTVGVDKNHLFIRADTSNQGLLVTDAAIDKDDLPARLAACGKNMARLCCRIIGMLLPGLSESVEQFLVEGF